MTRTRCLLAVFSMVLSLSAGAATERRVLGRVVGIADGDTLTILDARKVTHRVRLAAVDAPERRQAFGRASKAALSDLVFQRDVVIVTSKTDRFGRIIGRVLVDGRDVALAQLRSGHVWFFVEYKHELTKSDRARYSEAEQDARRNRRGLWTDASPTPPWAFRRAMRRSR